MKKQCNKRPYASVQLDVTVQHVNANGEVSEAIAADAKLTKADAGRVTNGMTQGLSITVEKGNGDRSLSRVFINAYHKH